MAQGKRVGGCRRINVRGTQNISFNQSIRDAVHRDQFSLYCFQSNAFPNSSTRKKKNLPVSPLSGTADSFGTSFNKRGIEHGSAHIYPPNNRLQSTKKHTADRFPPFFSLRRAAHINFCEWF